jgi:hypothetical protein
MRVMLARMYCVNPVHCIHSIPSYHLPSDTGYRLPVYISVPHHDTPLTPVSVCQVSPNSVPHTPLLVYVNVASFREPLSRPLLSPHNPKVRWMGFVYVRQTEP